MASRRFEQFFNTLHNFPVLLDAHWTVDATNAFGVTGLQGPGIQNVYMHTSTTPAAGNPNPASGYIIIQLQDNYKKYYDSMWSLTSPATGSALTSGMTLGVAYQIFALGASTAAQWQTAGLPVGITPAVGATFIAKATSVAGGGSVKLPGQSGIGSIEAIGNPNMTISSTAGNIPGISSGSYLMYQCLAPTSSSVTTPLLTAPAAGTIMHVGLYFSNSRILNKGE